MRKNLSMMQSLQTLVQRWGLITGLLFSVSAQAASFDCAKAKSNVEKMICADAELSRLDEEMAATFHQTINSKAKREALLQEQKHWLKTRAICGDASCLKVKYQDRISKLALDANAGWDFVLQASDGPQGDWLEDADDAMCKQIKDYMNKVARKWEIKQGAAPMNHCSSAVENAPFLSEPPWEELDPRKYEELIVKLLWSRLDPDGYFDGKPPRFNYGESYFRKQAREFIEKGGRLQHWRARMVDYLSNAEGARTAAPLGNQVVIQLRHTHDAVSASSKATGCTPPNWDGQVFLVTSDLREPIRYRDDMNNLYVYEGDPVLVASGSYEVSVRSPYYSRTNHHCRLTYPNHTSADIQEGK